MNDQPRISDGLELLWIRAKYDDGAMPHSIARLFTSQPKPARTTNSLAPQTALAAAFSNAKRR